jgi:hypothetical protein
VALHEVFDQRGLACAGFAANGDDAPPAGVRFRVRLLQALQLLVPFY